MQLRSFVGSLLMNDRIGLFNRTRIAFEIAARTQLEFHTYTKLVYIRSPEEADELSTRDS